MNAITNFQWRNSRTHNRTTLLWRDVTPQSGFATPTVIAILIAKTDFTRNITKITERDSSHSAIYIAQNSNSETFKILFRKDN